MKKEKENIYYFIISNNYIDIFVCLKKFIFYICGLYSLGNYLLSEYLWSMC